MKNPLTDEELAALERSLEPHRQPEYLNRTGNNQVDRTLRALAELKERRAWDKDVIYAHICPECQRKSLSRTEHGTGPCAECLGRKAQETFLKLHPKVYLCEQCQRPMWPADKPDGICHACQHVNDTERLLPFVHRCPGCAGEIRTSTADPPGYCSPCMAWVKKEKAKFAQERSKIAWTPQFPMSAAIPELTPLTPEQERELQLTPPENVKFTMFREEQISDEEYAHRSGFPLRKP